MVNRNCRNAAADVIERFLAAEITNDDFDAAYPRDKGDSALGAIYERLWFHFDDRRTHVLSGKHAPDEATRAVFERCLAFLKSDLEYEWPPGMMVASLSLLLLRALGLRKAIERRERQTAARLRSIGDTDVWPFFRAQDWDRAKLNPRKPRPSPT